MALLRERRRAGGARADRAGAGRARAAGVESLRRARAPGRGSLGTTARREALSDVSLTLAGGPDAGVFGPNGAGKTTLLRVLATLLRPHAGIVRVLGCRLPDEAWAVRGRIGLLGHEPLLYRELTARENLRFHARLHGVARESASTSCSRPWR